MLGAKFVRAASEVLKKEDVPSECVKDTGDGPVLFKHGWTSPSLFQGK